ncbi:MAG TPA: DUF1499 domain-containing protein [Usitatibacter sp.]|nr:DUF1499 domain-containing protein [Usitatibacter sp.]
MPATPSALGKVPALVLLAASLGLLLVAGAGPLTRGGVVRWELAFTIVKWGFFLGVAAAAGALILLVLLAVPRFRARPWVPVVALCVALAAAAPPLIILGRAESAPPIHDITTDTADPPAFVGLLEERRRSPNGFTYGGEAIAEQQRKAYGDIKPLVMKVPPREATQRAIDAARSLGWEVVSSDAASGRVEATDTTMWFGFKDDVIVRVRAEGEGSRVDVRSVSRVGGSDLGANAARIRSFLAKLA